MRCLLILFTSFLLFSSSHLYSSDWLASFLPPEGWCLADDPRLPPSIQVMVVGSGKHCFPPSINLAVEPFEGTLDEYIKIVKKMNQTQNSHWRELGPIKSGAGSLHISQLDTLSEWGSLRMMHGIMVKEGHVYILTAAAIKEEFSNYQKEFFRTFSSFSLKKELKETCNDSASDENFFKELQKNTNV